MIRKFRRRIYDAFSQSAYRRLSEKWREDTPSVVCNNCFGGVMLHHLGCRFCSPFVNLFLVPDEFVRLVENWEEAVAAGLGNVSEVKDSGMPYPVGRIDSVGSRIFFNHDTDFNVARDKWRERVERIRPDRTIFMFTAAMGDVESLRRFDQSRVGGKIAFASETFATLDLPSLLTVKGWRDDDPEYNMKGLLNGWDVPYIQSLGLLQTLSQLADIR